MGREVRRWTNLQHEVDVSIPDLIIGRGEVGEGLVRDRLDRKAVDDD